MLLDALFILKNHLVFPSIEKNSFTIALVVVLEAMLSVF